MKNLSQVYSMGVILSDFFFFISCEEVSKPAGERVFCGMALRCPEMAIHKSSKKVYLFEKC